PGLMKFVLMSFGSCGFLSWKEKVGESALIQYAHAGFGNHRAESGSIDLSSCGYPDVRKDIGAIARKVRRES
ncbi:MAG: hypothetical protein ABI618_03995, partial [Nitrospirota bacterium]